MAPPLPPTTNQPTITHTAAPQCPSPLLTPLDSHLLSPTSYFAPLDQPLTPLSATFSAASQFTNSSNYDDPPTSPTTMSSPVTTRGLSSPPSYTPPPSGPGSTTSPPARSPFNFSTQYISASPIKPTLGQRRGHRYKHSSISLQNPLVPEPPPRPPPVLPASLPVPTLSEAWSSTDASQRIRLYWTVCHSAAAGLVFLGAGTSLARTALAHLVVLDALAGLVGVGVDVVGNFAVWTRSTVRHPFGLRRAEVLAGFALAVLLLFGALDLLSHDARRVLGSWGEGGGGEEEHHGHGHGSGEEEGEVHGLAPSSLSSSSSRKHLVSCLVALLTTLINAHVLGNHSRVRRVLRVPGLTGLVGSQSPVMAALANPFHALTLASSLLLLLFPLISLPAGVATALDHIICAVIAASMFILGKRLAVVQGHMLLMSFGGRLAIGGVQDSRRKVKGLRAAPPSPPVSTARSTPLTDAGLGASSSSASLSGMIGAANSSQVQPPSHHDHGAVGSVVREIEAEPQVVRVERAQFWQVHYGLAMASLTLYLERGVVDEGGLSALQSRVVRLIQSRLGEGYGCGEGLRWEVTVQIRTEGR